MFEKELDEEIKTQKNYRGYLFIWVGQSISLLGSAIVQFAIIWWLTVETGSSFILALATFAGFLPMILFSPIAGVVVDRISRKIVLISTDLLQAIATLVLVVLFMMNVAQIWQILVLLAVRGSCQAFQMPAGMSIVSLMVPEEKLSKINAYNSIVNSMIYLVSPGLGALLLEIINAWDILWLDVFTFIPAAIAIVMVSIPGMINEKSKINGSSFKSEFTEALRYIRRSEILTVTIIGAVFNFFGNPLFSFLPLLIVQVHSGGSIEFAFIEIMFYAGLLGGSLFIAFRKNYRATVNRLIASILILAFSVIFLAFVPQGSFIIFGGLILICGIIVAFTDVQTLTLLQTSVPAELQGRVYSISFTIIKSVYPVALILLGMIAESVSLSLLFIISPVIAIVITFLILLKSRRNQLNAEKGRMIQQQPDIKAISGH